MRGDFMLSAVTRAVAGRFPDMIVANERVERHVQTEFIFVQQFAPKQTPDTENRYARSYLFDVRYHPDEHKTSPRHRMGEMFEGLMECLAYVATGDRPVKAKSIRGEVQDGVLHCFAEYALRVGMRTPECPDMQELDILEKLKNRE